jgi:hypothetical protein
MTDTGVTINGNLLPWSFVRRVWKKCGRDWEQTVDCFWKARNATGPAGVQKYIMAGFASRNGGVPYMLQPSKDRQTPGGMKKLWSWWHGLYTRKIKDPVISRFASMSEAKNPVAVVRSEDVKSMKDIFAEVFGDVP